MGGHRVTIGVMHGGRRILLSVVKPCGMDEIPSMTLDMYENPHLIICYLLKDKWEDFESKSFDWNGNMRG